MIKDCIVMPKEVLAMLETDELLFLYSTFVSIYTRPIVRTRLTAADEECANEFGRLIGKEFKDRTGKTIEAVLSESKR